MQYFHRCLDLCVPPHLSTGRVGYEIQNLIKCIMEINSIKHSALHSQGKYNVLYNEGNLFLYFIFQSTRVYSGTQIAVKETNYQLILNIKYGNFAVRQNKKYIFCLASELDLSCISINRYRLRNTECVVSELIQTQIQTTEIWSKLYLEWYILKNTEVVDTDKYRGCISIERYWRIQRLYLDW